MPYCSINYTWSDYNPHTMQYVDDWLDESAISATGLDDGFRAFYDYWANEDGFVIGENFWCKVITENGIPLAVIAFCQHDQTIFVMEVVVATQHRGRGIGTKLLKELLNSNEIIGCTVQKSEAVIFSSNLASQRAFEKAGYRYQYTYEDGTAMIYSFQR